jgi:nucleoredoxin
MSQIAEIFPSGSVVDKTGNAIDLKKHCAGKTVGIYFSAHWCPPCRGFTPLLAKFYTNNSKNKNFEVIFVSSDSDEASFQEYYHSMPWLALEYKQRDLKVN